MGGVRNGIGLGMEWNGMEWNEDWNVPRNATRKDPFAGSVANDYGFDDQEL